MTLGHAQEAALLASMKEEGDDNDGDIVDSDEQENELAEKML